MAFMKNKLTILVLCALVAAVACQASQGGGHQSQGGPHENQAPQGVADSDDDGYPPVWTTCNFATTPAISCSDCNTRLICKPVGGLLKPCRHPLKPHCNNGICSRIPAAGC